MRNTMCRLGSGRSWWPRTYTAWMAVTVIGINVYNTRQHSTRRADKAKLTIHINSLLWRSGSLTMSCLRLPLFRRRCQRRRQWPTWWFFRGLDRFLNIHFPNNVAQDVGESNNAQQPAFFTTLSFFLLTLLVHTSLVTTNPPNSLTSPSTTTRRCTRRFLMSCKRVPMESDAVQITTPGKSGER